MVCAKALARLADQIDLLGKAASSMFFHRFCEIRAPLILPCCVFIYIAAWVLFRIHVLSPPVSCHRLSPSRVFILPLDQFVYMNPRIPSFGAKYATEPFRFVFLLPDLVLFPGLCIFPDLCLCTVPFRFTFWTCLLLQ